MAKKHVSEDLRKEWRKFVNKYLIIFNIAHEDLAEVTGVRRQHICQICSLTSKYEITHIQFLAILQAIKDIAEDKEEISEEIINEFYRGIADLMAKRNEEISQSKQAL